MDRFDVVVVGGGIVGLASAWSVLGERPGASVLLLEKEDAVAAHQTGRNSGVIHSGIYYPPGSLKAAMVAQSRPLLVDLCTRHGVPVEFPGKVIVATEPHELPRLQSLFDRGRAHGLQVRMLDAGQLREHEPHVAGLAGVHLPEAGITDYAAVARALVAEIHDRGGEVRLGSEVTSVDETGNGAVVHTKAGDVAAGHVIVCAGLQSDAFLRGDAAAPDLRIVPFRGEYFELTSRAVPLVRSLIYPVPDPRFPFLGVHLTRGVDGGVHAGPNAVLALAREGYRWRDVEPRTVAELAGYPGMRKLVRRYWRVGLAEVHRSMSKRAFTRAVQRLVPEISRSDLVRTSAGVRAQALLRDGRLVDDFAFRRSAHVVNVLNAPSPAATASLAIGRHVAAQVMRAPA